MEFSVKPKKLNSVASTEREIRDALNSASVSLDSCRNNLTGCLSSAASPSIDRAINAVRAKIGVTAGKIGTMGDKLDTISVMYTRTESNIAGKNMKADNIQKAKSYNADGSVKGGFLGFVLPGAVSGALAVIGDVETSSGWTAEKNNLSWGASASKSGSLLEGEVSGKKGNLSGSASAKILTGSAEGSISASLYKDGKLDPSLSAKLEAKGSLAEVEAKGQYGNDDTNLNVSAKGELGSAEAKAEVQLGRVESTTASGKKKTELGIEGSVGAGAWLAKGSITGGASLLGLVDVNVTATGKAGGASIGASGSVTTGGVSGKLDVGLGVGADVEVTIDWSSGLNKAVDISEKLVKKARTVLKYK